MRLPSLIRFAALAACLCAAGCGESSSITENPPGAIKPDASAPAAPRTLETPLHALPLAATTAIDRSPVSAESAVVQISQAGDVRIASQIRDLAGTPDPAASGMIREPGATPPEVQEPAQPATAGPPRRNTFVPIAMPVITPPRSTSEPPLLAARPAFDLPPSSQPARTTGTVAGSAPATQPAAAVPSKPLATALPPANIPAAQARVQAQDPAAHHAAELSDQAWALANRGLLGSARADLLKSLQLMAQALDAQRGGAIHTAALQAGLTALKEADDFTPALTSDKLIDVARSHATPVLRNQTEAPPSPELAQQRYLAYAQAQLTVAADGLPMASQTLHRLGRVQSGLATASISSQLLASHGIVFQQAALAADGTNYLAANELGVLLARRGQLPDARLALLQSIGIRPHAEGWHNLAVVHRRLGEHDLAARAEHERDRLASHGSDAAMARKTDSIRWAAASTFAAHQGGDVPWRENAGSELAAAAAGQRR